MDTQNSTVISSALELEPEPLTPTRIQPPQPTTNGVLKRRPRIHIHHHRHPVVVTYKECLKNHAAPNGGHSIDGCGEFLPAQTSNPSRPQSLYCDVCGCHRNFHRRDEEYYFSLPLMSRNRHVHIAKESCQTPPAIPSLAPLHMLMGGSNPNNNVGVSRKRFRTKFTQDQKGKMLDLAERVGWKMQKRNEVVINESCMEIGVEKGVFKVWMHNNKNTIGKKETYDNSIAAAVVTPTIMVNNGNLGNGEKNEENGNGNGNGEENGVIVGTNNNDSSAASDLLI